MCVEAIQKKNVYILRRTNTSNLASHVRNIDDFLIFLIKRKKDVLHQIHKFIIFSNLNFFLMGQVFFRFALVSLSSVFHIFHKFLFLRSFY